MLFARWRGTYEWDEAKNRENIARHGIDLSDAHRCFARPMLVRLDDRDFGEDRWIALGDLDGILVVLVFTEREERFRRIISLRKANRRERQAYEEAVGGTTE